MDVMSISAGLMSPCLALPPVVCPHDYPTCIFLEPQKRAEQKKTVGLIPSPALELPTLYFTPSAAVVTTFHVTLRVKVSLAVCKRAYWCFYRVWTDAVSHTFSVSLLCICEHCALIYRWWLTYILIFNMYSGGNVSNLTASQRDNL